MSRRKDLDTNPSLDSNQPGRKGEEKMDYDRDIGRDESSIPEENTGDKEAASTPSRRKRIKVTVQRPKALEELADMLGSSKAGVYNVALGMLAENMGVDR